MIGRLAKSLRVVIGGLRAAWSDPTTRTLIGLTGVFVLVATVFFMFVEGWSLLDALFFSVATISTVGYGDVVPATAAGKIFSIGYIFAGIGIFVVTAASIADLVIRYVNEAADRQKWDD